VQERSIIVENVGRSQIQQILKNLAEQAYIEVHRSCPDTDTVKDILWAHWANIDLLYVFSQVLIIDCTYKTNRYWWRSLGLQALK